jgi:hypothetical protein
LVCRIYAAPSPDRYNTHMPTEGEKRKAKRSGKRLTLAVAAAVALTVACLVAAWCFTPFVMQSDDREEWYRRDWRGRLVHLRSVGYFAGSRRKFFECGPGGSDPIFFDTNGREAPIDQFFGTPITSEEIHEIVAPRH